MVDFSLITKAYEGDVSPDVRLLIERYYFELFNKKIANPQCDNCIRDAAIEIMVKMKDTKKYLLFAHIPLQINGKWYTQGTLSDEDAEQYLKENPKDIVKFKRVPRNKKAEN